MGAGSNAQASEADDIERDGTKMGTAASDQQSKTTSTDDHYYPIGTTSADATAAPLHSIEMLIASGKNVVNALYDYAPAPLGDSTGIPDLNFKKGDLMEIVHEVNKGWWLARNVITWQVGYVPSNYVRPFSGFQSYEWFHGCITREEATSLLVENGNGRGAFLVRNSQSYPCTYALSVLDYDKKNKDSVKHYLIRNLYNGGFHISPKMPMNSLEQLINYHSGSANGLCCRLTTPCPRQTPGMYDSSKETHSDNHQPEKQDVRLPQLSKQPRTGHFNKVRRVIAKTTQMLCCVRCRPEN